MTGPSRNPHDIARMSGGSSGGSGSAVGGGLVPLALGSDTNGSIRVPSSFCGLFGLEADIRAADAGGELPVRVQPGSSGAVRLVRRRIWRPPTMRCRATTRTIRSPPIGRSNRCQAGWSRGIGGLRIASAGGYFRAGAAPEALAAVDAHRRGAGRHRDGHHPGCAASPEALPISSPPPKARRCTLSGCAARPDDFDPDVRDRLIAGALVPAAAVVQAQKFRRRFREQVLHLFDQRRCDPGARHALRRAADRAEDVRAGR